MSAEVPRRACASRTFKLSVFFLPPARHGPFSDKLGQSRMFFILPIQSNTHIRHSAKRHLTPAAHTPFPTGQPTTLKMLSLLVCSTPSECPAASMNIAAQTDSCPRQPIVTGTSVLALKYKDGVMMAADNLGAFPLSHQSRRR